jgi:hypothetical protein
MFTKVHKIPDPHSWDCTRFTFDEKFRDELLGLITKEEYEQV